MPQVGEICVNTPEFRINSLFLKADFLEALLQELVARGFYTPEEAQRAAAKNYVTRALGVEPTVEVEITEVPALKDDVYVLCSDGLSDMLDDESIAQLLQSSDALPEVAAALVDAANDAGGKDNISLVLARTAGGAPAASRSWWPFRR